MNKDTLIKRYVENQLTPKQKKEFEKQMQSDLVLQEAVNDYWLIEKILTTDYQMKLLTELTALEGVNNKQVTAKQAALFTQFFMPFRSDMLTDDMIARSPKEQGSDDIFAEAIYYYNNTEYDKAIKHFSKIKVKENYYVAALLYLGNAYLAVQKPIMAVAVFEQLLDMKEAVLFKEVIEWYLALALLAAKESTIAIALLKNIAVNSADRYYRKKATAMLSKLMDDTETL